MLTQNRFWRSSLSKDAKTVSVELLREGLPEELRELRELRIDVPIDKWNRVVKQVLWDRKLLGGILLDFAKHKERVSAAIAHDRVLVELQRVVLDTTTVLVENGTLALTVVDVGGD